MVELKKHQIKTLIALVIVATIVDQFVIHQTNWAGWAYIFMGWFVVWIGCFLILKRKWLSSIAAVFILSVVEDALFLLWDRIIGRTLWDASFYNHAWVPFSYDWGIPSHYVYSLVIAGSLIWITKRSIVDEVLPW